MRFFFGLLPCITKSTIADNNLDIILTYKAIQKEPEALIALLKQHATNHSKEYYYAVRVQDPITPLEVAARFLYLNKIGYNGLYRVNKSGKFNTPMDNYDNPNIIQERNILACSAALKKVTCSYGDFEKIKPECGNFVYFDSPYHPTDENSFTEYTKDILTEKEKFRLRDLILSLHKKCVFIMLSNSKTKFIHELYEAKYLKQYTVRAP